MSRINKILNLVVLCVVVIILAQFVMGASSIRVVPQASAQIANASIAHSSSISSLNPDVYSVTGSVSNSVFEHSTNVNPAYGVDNSGRANGTEYQDYEAWSMRFYDKMYGTPTSLVGVKPGQKFIVMAGWRVYNPSTDVDSVKMTLYINGVEKQTKNITPTDYVMVPFQNVSIDSYGNHEIKVIIDPDNDVTEQWENNNTMKLGIGIGYDLKTYDMQLQFSKDPIKSGEQIKISTYVQNVGAVAVPKTQTEFYYYDSSGERVGILVDTKALNPNTATYVEGNLRIFADEGIWTEKQITIYAKADSHSDYGYTESGVGLGYYNGIVKEYDEANNISKKNITVLPGLADLEVESLSIQNKPKAGEAIDFQVSYKNSGAKPAGANKLQIWIKENGIKAVLPGDQLGLWSTHYGKAEAVDVLQSNESVVQVLSKTVPTGKWKVCATIDADEEIAEIDESNNTKCVKVQVGDSSGFDWPNGGNGPQVYNPNSPGKPVTMDELRNGLSGSPAMQGVVRPIKAINVMHTSEDESEDTIYFAKIRVVRQTSLTSKLSKQYSKVVVVNGNATKQVSNVNETAASPTFNWGVSGDNEPSRADLMIESIEIDPESDCEPKEGDTVTITAEAKNIGNKKANNVYVEFAKYHEDEGTTVLGLSAISSLDASQAQKVSINLDCSEVGEDYRIDVTADPNDTIKESNESNNYAYKWIKINYARPDFDITSLTLPNIAIARTAYDLSFSNKNVGNTMAASSDATMTFDKEMSDGWTLRKIRTVQTGSIAVKQTANATAQFMLTEGGNYEVCVEANKYRKMEELSYKNNKQCEDLFVSEKPEVSITSPLNGITVSGTITIKGTASAAYTAVSNVEVQIDSDGWNNATPKSFVGSPGGAISGPIRIPTSTTPVENGPGGDIKILADWSEWTYTWDTTAYSDAAHTISARAYDDRAYSDTAMISVNVDNTTPPNIIPTVTITAPIADENISGTYSITGTAADSDGTVSAVEVSIDGGTWLNTSNTGTNFSTWSYSWNSASVSDGNHTISARSYDSTDYSTVASVSITTSNGVTNTIPTITITSPSDGATVSGTINVTGTASDSDGTVSAVEIQIDATAPGSWTTVTGTTTWSYAWDTSSLTDGNHTIYARSYDGIAYSTVASRPVTVNNGSSTPGDVDLVITATDISYNLPTPIVTDIETITATIHNNGTDNAISADVAFYLGDPALGNQIGSTQTISVTASGSTTVTQDWLITAKGSFNIYVVVSNSNPTETDITNNRAYVTIDVQTTGGGGGGGGGGDGGLGGKPNEWVNPDEEKEPVINIIPGEAVQECSSNADCGTGSVCAYGTCQRILIPMPGEQGQTQPVAAAAVETEAPVAPLTGLFLAANNDAGRVALFLLALLAGALAYELAGGKVRNLWKGKKGKKKLHLEKEPAIFAATVIALPLVIALAIGAGYGYFSLAAEAVMMAALNPQTTKAGVNQGLITLKQAILGSKGAKKE